MFYRGETPNDWTRNLDKLVDEWGYGVPRKYSSITNYLDQILYILETFSNNLYAFENISNSLDLVYFINYVSIFCLF